MRHLGVVGNYIASLNAHDKASYKGDIISSLGNIKRSVFGKYHLEITDFKPVSKGMECYVRAWDFLGNPIGFGIDGTIEYERFRFINPPILVPDGTTFQFTNAFGDKVTDHNYKEDYREAFLSGLQHTVSCVAKPGTFIVKGKYGTTTTTVYPEATGGSVSTDGEAWRTVVAENFSTIRGGNGTNADDVNATGWCYYIAGTAGVYTDLYTGIHAFDTSSIPDTDDVSAWTMSFVGSTVVAPANTIGASSSQAEICICDITLGANNTIATSDYQARGSSLKATRFAYASWVNDNSTYNDITGTVMSFINKTGTTASCSRSGADFDNANLDSGTGVLRLYMKKADSAGTSVDPKLVITHAAPPPANGGTMLLMGVG